MIESDNTTVQGLPEFDLPLSVLIVVAPYYNSITDQLINGALEVLKKVNAQTKIVEVPGALEIPTAIQFASMHFSGFVALGCVIRGETSHYETVSNESARALSSLGLKGICIGNGILTVENFEQAVVRADLQSQNKGGEAAHAALSLIKLKENFEQPPSVRLT